ncbi:hypothetical protein [Glutamicibacter ardleyensis]|uniref:hypothetical protein n=1 Tax=Glutamicibacter ardleyensis TaxID=225894 RepID=UPI003FD223C4
MASKVIALLQEVDTTFVHLRDASRRKETESFWRYLRSFRQDDRKYWWAKGRLQGLNSEVWEAICEELAEKNIETFYRVDTGTTDSGWEGVAGIRTLTWIEPVREHTLGNPPQIVVAYRDGTRSVKKVLLDSAEKLVLATPMSMANQV